MVLDLKGFNGPARNPPHKYPSGSVTETSL